MVLVSETARRPYGGKTRQIQVDLDPQAMQADGLSAADVQNALANQDQIKPVGTAKIGSFQYMRSTSTIRRRDNRGFQRYPGQDDGRRHRLYARCRPCARRLAAAAKRGACRWPARGSQHHSQERHRLDPECGQGRLGKLPLLKRKCPTASRSAPLNDQSVFVKAAVNGVVREGTIAALLTSLMVLLFLGSWRSTLIIAISIPCRCCAP